ncbi:MAG: hypothetical protein HC901_00050 [Bdellovibrionaceae bacterium]|nr:hypothetical protein [Pseudobdellovibrionaceae bacterium]
MAALEQAAEAWHAYTANVLERYINRIWMSRVRTGPIDFEQITEWVEQDTEIARAPVGK